jgi:glutamate 5-kinase
MHLNKSMLTAYQDRWKTVAEIEEIEQQQASVAQRWRKLNALVRMAAGQILLQREDYEAQISVVRERWNRLTQLHL